MKTKRHLIICFAALAAGTLNVPADTPAVTHLERGVALMDEGAQWTEAIREFEAILKEEKKSRRLSAEARYHLARCHLALGDEQKAHAQVEALLSDYGDQEHWAIKARNLLPKPSIFGATPWQSGEFLEYAVSLPNGRKVGQFYLTIHAAERNGRATWITAFTRSAKATMQSVTEFDAQSFRPIEAKSCTDPYGSFETSFHEDGSWRVVNMDTQEEVLSGKPGQDGQGADPIFENDQALQLMRTLPTEIGAQIKLDLLTGSFGGGLLPFEIEAAAHETIQVKSGEFDCVKYTTNINQTFWIEREGRRLPVRMEISNATVDLVDADEVWDPHTPTTIDWAKIGGAITVPNGVIYRPMSDTVEKQNFGLTDTEFRFRMGWIKIRKTDDLEEKLRISNHAYLNSLFEKVAKNASEVTADGQIREMETDDGRKALIGTVTVRQGKLSAKHFILVSHGTNKTLTIALQVSPEGSEEVEEILQEMFESWEE